MNLGTYAAVLASTWGLFFGLPTTLLAYMLITFPPVGDQAPKWFTVAILTLGFSAICSFAFPLRNGYWFSGVTAIFFLSIAAYLWTSSRYIVTMPPNENGEIESVIRGNLKPEYAGQDEETLLEGVGTSDKALSGLYIEHTIAIHQTLTYLPYVLMFASLEFLCGFAAKKALMEVKGVVSHN